MECLSPAQAAEGYQSLKVTLNDQNYFDDGLEFEYQRLAHVLKVTPAKGAAEGGTFVNVTGTDFSVRSWYHRYMYCRFNVTTVEATWVSSNEMHCYAPQHAKGVVSVEISMNNQQYTNDGTQYEYQGVSLTNVLPLGGPVDGGTLVHINGSNIHPMDVKGLQCTFGLADRVNASFQSNEQVSCNQHCGDKQ